MANPEPSPSTIQAGLNDHIFAYDSAGFTCFRYQWDPHPSYEGHLPILYFRSQLAFRGYSTRGIDLEAMKAQLRGAENVMDEQVAILGEDMRRRWGDIIAHIAQENQRAGDRLVTTRGIPDVELAKSDPVQFLRTWFFDQNGTPDHNAPVVVLPEQHRVGDMRWWKAGSEISPNLTSMPVHDRGEMLEIVGWLADVEAAAKEIDQQQWHKNEDVSAMFQERTAFLERHPELRPRPRGTWSIMDM